MTNSRAMKPLSARMVWFLWRKHVAATFANVQSQIQDVTSIRTTIAQKVSTHIVTIFARVWSAPQWTLTSHANRWHVNARIANLHLEISAAHLAVSFAIEREEQYWNIFFHNECGSVKIVFFMFMRFCKSFLVFIYMNIQINMTRVQKEAPQAIWFRSSPRNIYHRAKNTWNRSW